MLLQEVVILIYMFIDGVVGQVQLNNSTNFSTAPGTSYIGTGYSR